MGCDYYVLTELIISYYDDKGEIITVIAHSFKDRRYLGYIKDEDSDDDYETARQKRDEELNKRLDENTYQKILFENNTWVKESYKTKFEYEFEQRLQYKCPNFVTLIKMYKDVSSWERE